jgi:pimeloyl-ACP methyl ester carboxylesterase
VLANRHRVCVYDRANVGHSDPVGGRLTGRDSAEDLHALLRSAEVPGPYVLLGASLGGAIADIFAAAHPKEVAGMFLLDSTLPDYLDMYKRLFPPGSGPQPNEWRKEAERLDRLETFRQAGQIQARRARGFQ